jgi:hypothetical protein
VLVPSRMKFRLGDDVRGRCYLGVVAKAANCVGPTADEIPAWGMMFVVDTTWVCIHAFVNFPSSSFL